MNERIRELAEQAGFKSVGKLFGQPIPEYAVPLEKFAELIVKECIEISQVGSITESKLKKHFGVE